MIIDINQITTSILTSTVIAAITSSLMSHKMEKAQKKQSKRWEVTEVLYEKMSIMDIKMQVYLSPLQGDEEAQRKNEEAAVVAFNDFAAYFCEKKIFIPAKIADAINKYIASMKTSFDTYQYGKDPYIKDHKAMLEAWKTYNAEIKETKSDLETMFRKSLGMKRNEYKRSRTKDDQK